MALTWAAKAFFPYKLGVFLRKDRKLPKNVPNGTIKTLHIEKSQHRVIPSLPIKMRYVLWRSGAILRDCELTKILERFLTERSRSVENARVEAGAIIFIVNWP